MIERELKDDEIEFIKFWGQTFKDTYENTFNLECDEITLDKIEEFYPYLRNTIKWNKKRRDNTVLIFGTSFGQFIVETLNYKWIIVEDKYGEEACVKNYETGQIICPYSIVRKRVRKKSYNYFKPIYESFKELDKNKQ